MPQNDPTDHDAPETDMSLTEMRGLVRMAIWAALIGVGGWVSIPLPGVPISLQTFFVALAGLVEGPKRGALAAELYLLAGLVGLPVFSGGLGGPAILLKPSAGFVLAFPLGAAVAGLAAPRRLAGEGRLFLRAFLLVNLGYLVIYAGGLLGLLINTSLDPLTAAKMLLTFIPGDLTKAAAAAALITSRPLIRWSRGEEPAGR